MLKPKKKPQDHERTAKPTPPSAAHICQKPHEAARAFLERNRKRAEARRISEVKRKADNKLNPRVK